MNDLPKATVPNFLTARAAEMTASNPANAAPTAPARRIPMALPTLKLEIPEIPGHVAHWFRGSGQRIQQALNAGYTFVNRGEVEVNGIGLANDYLGDNNSDMGTRVSVSAGGESAEDSQGMRLYLRKIKKELWDEDQAAVDAQHEQVAAQLRGDKGFSEGGQDTSHRYSKGEQKRNMFQPKPRSA